MYHLLKLDNQVQTAGLKLLKYNKLHIYYTQQFPSANSDTELIIGQLLYWELIWN